MKHHNVLKLAQAIKENTSLYSPDLYINRAGFLIRLCDILSADNPRFNREKFEELLK